MVLFSLILHLLFMEKLSSSGIGVIEFLSYIDYTDCGADDTCDFYLKNLLIQDSDGIILYKIDETAVTDDTHTVDLTKVISPAQIKTPTNKTIEIVTDVWEEDTWPNPDDKVRSVGNFEVPFETVLVGDDWKMATKNIGTTVTFTVRYELKQCDANFTGLGCNYCKPGYYNELCDKYCVPVSGNYTCNSTTGDKICGNRTTGADCDKCAVNYYPEGACNVYCTPVAKKFNCNKQGGRDCLENWTGTDCESCVSHHYGTNCDKFCNETANYRCNDSGDKDCKDYFYPQHQCDTYCKPVARKHNCTDQGDQVCFKNWNGTDCDSCSTHYFGTNCSTFCNETANYKCNGSGDRQCREHYYPGKLCDTYCKPIEGTYRCNQTTGEKICKGNRSGEDCEQCVQNYYPKGQCDVYSTALIGGAGGGAALIFILLVVAMLVALSRRRKRRKLGQKHPESGVQVELVEEDDTYADIIITAQSETEGDRIVQAEFNKEMTQSSASAAEEEEAYAYADAVQSVKSRAGDSAVVHSNPSNDERNCRDPTYANELVEEDDTYADITITAQSQTEGDRIVQAEFNKEMTQSSASAAEEEEAYAYADAVQFMKSRAGDSAVVYSNPSNDERNCGNPTYANDTELL